MHHNLIAGEWLAGTGLRRNINPSDTSDLVGEYAHADAAQTERAIQAARQAFPAWSRGSVQARADALEKIAAELLARKDELGNLLAREEGKTLPEAIGEVSRAGNIFKFYAGECLRQAGEVLASVRPGVSVEVTREPLGVIGLIDITDPKAPKAMGNIAMGGEPTTAKDIGGKVFVGVEARTRSVRPDFPCVLVFHLSMPASTSSD